MNVPSVVLDVERVKHLYCGLGQLSLHLGHAILDATGSELEPVLLLRPRHQQYYAGRSVRFLDATTWRRDPVAGLVRPLLRATGVRERFDLWHATHQDSKYLPLDRRTPLVLTIHDLNILREKKPAAFRRRLRLLQRKVNRATVLTTGSQFAADEIRCHLDVGEKEIAVIANGVCISPMSNPLPRPAFLPEGSFLFTIGDITPKKNFHVLVDFFKQIAQSGRPDLRLVIAGSKRTDYAARIDREIQESGLAGRVFLPGNVSDDERSWLYHNCDAFLFPSISEGFGLPVIEAMSCGRPVFLANATSLPEVGGPLAFYWDDFSSHAMSQVFTAGMAIARQDSQYGNKLRLRASQFTWSRAADAYLSLYRQVLNGVKDGEFGRVRHPRRAAPHNDRFPSRH
ncbi:MAG: glycosyltransferase family 4 protein [Planctomycetia bacterium]|nr:glycosyltransferase family 4 protein [Planctomycetia bacterium]